MADVKSLVDEANKLTEEDRTAFLTEFLSAQKVLWLANAIKALEDKFGVKAQAAAVAVAGGGGAPAAQEEEKSTFDVVLKALKDKGSRLNAIKAVREITKLGLQEAKALVDGAPKAVKEGVSKEEADKIKKDLEAAGGEVELK